MASVTAELAGKCVQLIRDMLPSARRVISGSIETPNSVSSEPGAGQMTNDGLESRRRKLEGHEG
jgi:hypothetical protein